MGRRSGRMPCRAKPSVFAALLASAAFSAPPAVAQAEQANQHLISYDIGAQPLSSALIEFARQSDVEILFPFERMRSISAPALKGRFTSVEGLDRLLVGSGFRGSFEDNGTILLQEIERPRDLAAETREDEPLQGGDDPADSAFETAEETIVITGTRIRGAAPVGSNVQSLDRERIEATGRATVQEVIQTLPQNFAGSQNEATQEGTTDSRLNMTFSSTVDLRGLGADATLTLLNGRRLAPAGFGNFVDISAIPLSAVERIEVLADGASAIYGSDAVGGVVNIILDRDFAGAETRARYGGATQGGASDLGFSQLAGWAWNEGSLTAAYDYRQRGALDIRDRDFLATSDLRARGGSNFSRTFANPGNITRIGSTTVSLAIPSGQDGTSLLESNLIADQPNFQELNEGSWFLPEQESHSIFLAGRQEITSGFEVFADVVASVRDTYFERENLTTSLVVPESNAYRQLNNLFPGQGPLTIAYFMGDDLGPVAFATETRSLSTALGFSYALPADWRLEMSAALAQSRESVDIENFFDSASIGPALASTDLAAAFNPFADGSNTDPAVLAGLTFSQHTRNDAETRTYLAKADGPLFEVWGGTLRAAVGAELREEAFTIDRHEIHGSGVSPRPTFDPGSRDVSAFFGEIYAPIVGEDENIPLVHALTLSLSWRREDASDYGAETTPKYGLRWELTPGLALRGTWGRSFKGPQFHQMLGPVVLTNLTATPAQDPLADNGSTGLLVVSGSNRDLKPERAETWTAGFDFRPPWARGLSFSATYFDIDFADRIASAGNPFDILRSPSGFEQVFLRDPSTDLLASFLALGPPPTGALPADGVEVIIDRRLVNLSSLRVRGADLNAEFTFDAGWGAFSLFANTSALFQYETTLVAGATLVELLDIVNNPVDWRARAGASWRNDAGSSAGITVNYVDDYRDTRSIPERGIASWTTWDLRLAQDFRGNQEGRGAQLALSVQNLFDLDPPFVNHPSGYALDASNHSALGRVVALEVRQTW